MTEQEYQTRILDLENEVSNLTSKITLLETNEQTLNTNLTELTEANQKLKEHNMSLFLKITEPVPTEQPKPQEPSVSVDDITEKLLEQKEM